MINEYNDIWDTVLKVIKNKTTETAFYLWIEPLEVEFLGANCLIIKRNKSFPLKIVEEQFDDLIKESFNSVTGLCPLIAYEPKE